MGQNKACYIYRFIAAGTMEEAIYNRQVTKISMSKRVVDEQQIDRHFKKDDLDQLYSIMNIESTNDIEQTEPPSDYILSNLMKNFKNVVHKYHCHDSLLQNKGDEALSVEERKLAWTEYENEKPQQMKSSNAIKFPCLQIGNSSIFP